jgi:hypothetical protein
MAAHHNEYMVKYMVKYFIEKDNYSSYTFDIFVKHENLNMLRWMYTNNYKRYGSNSNIYVIQNYNIEIINWLNLNIPPTPS